MENGKWKGNIIGVSAKPVLCVVLNCCVGLQKLIVADSSLSLYPIDHYVADRTCVVASATPTHSAHTETSTTHTLDKMNEREKRKSGIEKTHTARIFDTLSTYDHG